MTTAQVSPQVVDMAGHGFPRKLCDWASNLALDMDEAESAALRRHEHTGRTLGDPNFIERLESQLGRFLRKRKPGPKGPGKTN